MPEEKRGNYSRILSYLLWFLCYYNEVTANFMDDFTVVLLR